MSDRIKLCPFCPKEISEEYPPKVASEVECGTPNFSVHAPCFDFYGPMRGTEDRAIKAWNRRAIPADHVLVPIELLEELLEAAKDGAVHKGEYLSKKYGEPELFAKFDTLLHP